MSDRKCFILCTDRVRMNALAAIKAAPDESQVEIKGPKRTLPQNARMWAMLTDVALQLQWYGKALTTEEWKLLFLDGLSGELRMIPNLDGTGFIPLGRSSSNLTKKEFGDLIEVIYAFGAQHGVEWSEPSREEAA